MLKDFFNALSLIYFVLCFIFINFNVIQMGICIVYLYLDNCFPLDNTP